MAKEYKRYQPAHGEESVEGIVEQAFTGMYPVDQRRATFVKLAENDMVYRFVDMTIRVDKGEKVKIYTYDDDGWMKINAMEILDEAGKPKFTYSTEVAKMVNWEAESDE